MLVDKPRKQANKKTRKQLRSCVCSFTILSCFSFNSAFVANVFIYSSKPDLFINPEMLD